MSRTETASGWSANGTYVVSATSAPPAIQYGIGLQASSGIASISRLVVGLWRIVMLKRAPIARQTATTAWP